MDVILVPLFWLITTVIEIYIWVLIIAAILSWLIAFNVVNTRNQFVYTLSDFFYRVTEPVLRPIRRFVPRLNGVDLSPMVLILLLYALQIMLYELRAKLV